MKKHYFFILIGIFLILSIGLWWQLSFRHEAAQAQTKGLVLASPHKEQKPPAVVSTPAPLSYQVTNGPDDEGTPVTTNSPVRSATVAARLLSTHPTASRVKVAALLSQLNDKDIDFYGKVVDQNDNAIPDVQVTGSAIYNSDRGSGVQEKHTTTDAKGYFEFHGLKGRSFDYHLEKAGYVTMPDPNISFDFTELVPANKRFHPDPKNPVVLKMWKLQGAEPIVKGNKIFKMPTDGTEVRLNMLTGTEVKEGGDVVVTLKHDVFPVGVNPPRREFDWTAQVSMVNGGLIESNQKLMYLAPEAGYKETQNFGAKATDAIWESGVQDRNFYFKIKDKLYGKMTIRISTSQKASFPSYISVSWYLNPSGSRNLEFDPKKQIPLPK